MPTATLPALPSSPPFSWLQRLLAALALLGVLSCMAVGAQQGATVGNMPERSVKAAFLYKFLAYIDFPGDPGPNLVVGVLGADELAAELAQVTAGRAVGNRSIVVRPLKEGDPLGGVQLLFIGAEAARPLQALRSANQNCILTVTEQDNGLQQGSAINFRVVDERVRFEVSLPAAERCNVKLSSRLLSVAYFVQKGGQ